MHQRYNPGAVAPPFSRYSHGVEASVLQRWLHISGQVGVRPDGTMADGIEAQIEQAFANLFQVLAAASMAKQDLVKITVFLVDRSHVGTFRTVRDRMLLPAEPASTLLVVAGLARDDFLVEIEAVAAAD